MYPCACWDTPLSFVMTPSYALYLQVFLDWCEAWVCVCVLFEFVHTAVNQTYIYFCPFVSSNFLPSRQCKYLQRHRPTFFVLVEGRSRMPSAALIGLLLCACWCQLLFPTLWAALGILSKELNFGKFRGYFPSKNNPQEHSRTNSNRNALTFLYLLLAVAAPRS